MSDQGAGFTFYFIEGAKHDEAQLFLAVMLCSILKTLHALRPFVF